MEWDRILSRIAEEVAKEHNVKVDDVKFIFETFWKNIRKRIDAMKGSAYIQITNFGRFFVPRYKLNDKILYLIFLYRIGKMDELEFRRAYDRYQTLRRKINKERPSTGKRWHAIKRTIKRREKNKLEKESRELSSLGEGELPQPTTQLGQKPNEVNTTNT